jgi:hypothetical protein
VLTCLRRPAERLLPYRETGCPFVLIEERVETLINLSGELILVAIPFFERMIAYLIQDLFVLSLFLLTAVITVSFLCYRWVHQLWCEHANKGGIGNQVKGPPVYGELGWFCCPVCYATLLRKATFVTLWMVSPRIAQSVKLLTTNQDDRGSIPGRARCFSLRFCIRTWCGPTESRI